MGLHPQPSSAKVPSRAKTAAAAGPTAGLTPPSWIEKYGDGPVTGALPPHLGSSLPDTFGVYPLQQYLIEFPDGRIQALSIAWDARPKAEGGQRWFHLYPNEPVPHNDM